MSKNISFVYKCLGFICLLILVDVVSGAVLNKLFYKQKSGKFYTTSHALNDYSEKIIIFGSSHAAQHFNAPLMKKELHTSVFNFGNQGQGLLYMYPLVKTILSVHKPELIILNLDYNELEYNAEDYKRLSILLPYTSLNKDVDAAIASIDPKEKYKARSSLYRYNSIIGYSLLNTYKPTVNKSYSSLGYDPVYGEACANLEEEEKNTIQPSYKVVTLDNHKIRQLTALITEIQKNKIGLIVTTTPVYNADVKRINPYAIKLKSILKNLHVDYVDDIHHPDFIRDCKLFNDLSHLNDAGATKWTNHLITYIKGRYSF